MASNKQKKTAKSKTQSFISSSRSIFFSDLGLKNPTLDKFKDFIKDKMIQLKSRNLPKDKQNPMYCGGICLQQLIIEKLNKLKSKSKVINKKQLEERLTYFKSEAFIENFTTALPTRDKKSKSALETSYAAFFNDLFNVCFPSWRDDKLSKIDNQTQCRRALGIKSSIKIVDLQELGKINCYLCGRKILSSTGTNQSTMECEHILPIITALSHWWLIKEKDYSSSEIEHLSYEYDWSHRCCNQIKSNVDFIIYDASSRGNFEYKVNMPMIEDILQKIKTEDKYDCKEIKPKSTIDKDQKVNIQRKIQPIVDEINRNTLHFNNHSEYLLLTKYKVLSALSDDDFIKSIIGNDDNNTKTNKSVKQKLQIPKRKDMAQILLEKRAWLMRMEQEEKQKMELKIKMQSEARMSRLNKYRSQGGLNSKISDLTDDAILEYDLPGYNEFEDFDDSNIIDAILTEEKYEPSLEELTETFDRIFIQNTYVNWDEETGAAHSFFIETEKPAITTYNKIFGVLPSGTISTKKTLPSHRATVKRNYTTAEIEKSKKTGLIPKDIVNTNTDSPNRQTKKRRVGSK